MKCPILFSEKIIRKKTKKLRITHCVVCEFSLSVLKFNINARFLTSTRAILCSEKFFRGWLWISLSSVEGGCRLK